MLSGVGKIRGSLTPQVDDVDAFAAKTVGVPPPPSSWKTRLIERDTVR